MTTQLKHTVVLATGERFQAFLNSQDELSSATWSLRLGADVPKRSRAHSPQSIITIDNPQQLARAIMRAPSLVQVACGQIRWKLVNALSGLVFGPDVSVMFIVCDVWPAATMAAMGCSLLPSEVQCRQAEVCLPANRYLGEVRAPQDPAEPTPESVRVRVAQISAIPLCLANVNRLQTLVRNKAVVVFRETIFHIPDGEAAANVGRVLRVCGEHVEALGFRWTRPEKLAGEHRKSLATWR